jgi:HAD superfamily hydrolase (TIGR01450 family)
MPYKPSVRLDVKSAARLIDSCDNFLFDCDGVIWHWPEPIPGSVAFINKLKQLGKKCFFITNNSTKTRSAYVDMFKKIGVEQVNDDDVVCTAWLLASYLRSVKFSGKCFVVGNPSMAHELTQQGIKHIGVGSNTHKVPDPSNFDYINKLGKNCELAHFFYLNLNLKIKKEIRFLEKSRFHTDKNVLLASI